MAYQFVEFDDTALPLLMLDQNHQPMPIESALMDSVGGAYDWRGSQRRAGRRQTLSLTGEFIGTTVYLVDDSGDYLVDDEGDFLVAGNAEQSLHRQVAEVMAKIGTRGQLWRKRLADDALQWKTARLIQVPWPRRWDDHAIRATLTCQFETLMEFWHVETATAPTVNTTSGVTASLLVEVVGQTVNDAVLTIECTSGALTEVTIVCAPLGIDLAWIGTVASGETLTIDVGDGDVASGVTDAYAGFSLGAGHTARGYLPISAGAHLFYITVTGGASTVTLTYYEQFA